MTDRQLSDSAERLLAITRAQGLPDELVHALVALLEACEAALRDSEEGFVLRRDTKEALRCAVSAARGGK